MTVVRVKVVVYEDDVEVGEARVGYYESQPYEVQLVTPDGVDAKVVNRKAGTA